MMNHQSEGRYYSNNHGHSDRSSRDERSILEKIKDDISSWFSDEDADNQTERFTRNPPREQLDRNRGRYADDGYRDRSFGRGDRYGSERSGSEYYDRDNDDFSRRYDRDDYGSGRRSGYQSSRGSRSGWDEDYHPDDSRRTSGASRSRNFQQSYSDYDRDNYLQPGYRSRQNNDDWRNESYRGPSYPSRYGLTGGDYGDHDQDYQQQRRSQFAGGRGPDQSYWYTEYWLIPGPYSGTGPKGYQRSPENLKEQVSERLEGHGELNASEVEVSVENCEVTLSGKVSSREQKRIAESCAESVRGVDDVHNHLKVESGIDKQSGDEQKTGDGAKSDGKKGKSAASSQTGF